MIVGEISSNYFNSKMPPEEKPLELVPYYDILPNHFVTSDDGKITASKVYEVTYGTLHPSISFTGF